MEAGDDEGSRHAGWESSGQIVHMEAALSDARPAPGELFEATMRLKIAEGRHVNANPASLEII
jgi:hypothetical protein